MIEEVVENKIKRSLKIRKINVWVMVSTIVSFVIAFGFLFSDNLYFRALFILPIGGTIYYYHRIKNYKKDLEYLPKFLHAYSRLKEKEDEGEYIIDGEEKIKVIYKTKTKTVKVPVEKIVYRDKVIKEPVEKIIYRDKIVEKPVEKIVEKPVEKIVYKTKVKKIKEGYVKKKNIYEDNNIFKAIEDMLAKQFYNVPLKDRAIRIYSMINQTNVDKKDQFEYEKENK